MSRKRWAVWCLVSMACVTFGAFGQAPPQVTQPDEAGYSEAFRAALEDAIRVLDRVLYGPDLASRRSLGQDGWEILDFAAYTAGSLARLGYRTVIVRAGDGGSATRVWVLVGLEVYDTTVWVPVDPLPGPSVRQSRLGVVARTDGGTLRFDPAFVAFDSVVELPPNLPPVAVIRPPVRILEQVAAAWFSHTSTDPDGEIVLYEWSFPGTDPETTVSSSIWHTFAAVGTYTVGLTVTDSRGAQASTRVTVKAVEENDCGCSGN